MLLGTWQCKVDPSTSRTHSKRLKSGFRTQYLMDVNTEIFQRMMAETLLGLEGISWICVFGWYTGAWRHHGTAWPTAYQGIGENWVCWVKVKLWKVSAETTTTSLSWSLDRQIKCETWYWKVRAVRELSPARDVQELKHVLGMFIYLGKYSPNLSTEGKPLYDLLR